MLAFLPLLALFAACGGGKESSPPPESARAEAVRDTSEEGAGLTTTITVFFSSNFTVDDRRVPLASHFELDVPRFGSDESDTVLVTSAEVSSSNARQIILTVDRLVPQGAELRMRNAAFGEDNEGELNIPVTSDIANPLVALLASQALAIGNPDIVTAGEPPAATEADRDTATQRQALTDHMTGRGSPQEVVDAALATYDGMSAEIVTSPKLRAALAALTGTFAEPAIASYMTEQNCTEAPAFRIAFEEPPCFPELFARVTYEATGRRVVSVNPTVEGERLEHLMSLLAHEAVHCDRLSGRFEEVAATAFDTLLYIQLLGAFPELALTGTPLAKELNVNAIAMINSGRVLPESVGILPSPGVDNVLPGTTGEFAFFAELVAVSYEQVTYNESPDEPLAQAYVAVLASVSGMQEASAFNLVYLDELVARAIDPAIYERALGALELGVE